MPVLHLLAGPNAAGKTTLYERVIGPATRLPFINPDQIAKARWPGDEERQAYQASRLAAQTRDAAIAERKSFVAETVFSHSSKLDLIRRAKSAGYLVILQVVMIPEELAVARVHLRADQGGHSVPVEKVRGRYRRLRKHLKQAIPLADETFIYDNTRARHPFRIVAHYLADNPAGTPDWPRWSPLGAADIRRSRGKLK